MENSPQTRHTRMQLPSLNPHSLNNLSVHTIVYLFAQIRKIIRVGAENVWHYRVRAKKRSAWRDLSDEKDAR